MQLKCLNVNKGKLFQLHKNNIYFAIFVIAIVLLLKVLAAFSLLLRKPCTLPKSERGQTGEAETV